MKDLNAANDALEEVMLSLRDVWSFGKIAVRPTHLYVAAKPYFILRGIERQMRSKSRSTYLRRRRGY